MTDVMVGNRSFSISCISSSSIMVRSTSSSGIINRSFGACKSSSSFISRAMSIFVGGGGGGCAGAGVGAGLTFGVVVAFDCRSGDRFGDGTDADDVVGFSFDGVDFILPIDVLAFLSTFFAFRRSSSSSLLDRCRMVYLLNHIN